MTRRRPQKLGIWKPVKDMFQKEGWSNYMKWNWQMKLNDNWKLAIEFSILGIVDNFDKSFSGKVVGMKVCLQQRMKGRELECVNTKNSMNVVVTKSGKLGRCLERNVTSHKMTNRFLCPGQ